MVLEELKDQVADNSMNVTTFTTKKETEYKKKVDLFKIP